MSCHGCAEKYGFLKKEYGCPSCKFSYCKKCLRFPMTDPKSGNQMQVCSKCSQEATARKEPLSVINALQRLESMDDPAKPPITVYKQQVRRVGLEELRRGLSFEDQELVERLESLKKDDNDNQGGSRGRRSSEKMEDEIAQRLARLKGEEYRPTTKQDQAAMLRNFKPETEQDLIAKYAAEAEMDSKYNLSLTTDLEERLARLRGEPGAGASTSTAGTSSTMNRLPPMDDADELTEEDQVKLILKKLQEELSLDKKCGELERDMEVDDPQLNDTGDTSQMESDEDIDVDELCGICSEKRATLICKECDDDIFCKRCFQELHRDLGENHPARPFHKK